MKKTPGLLALGLLPLLVATSSAATATYTSPGPHFLHDGPVFFVLTLEVPPVADPVSEIYVTFTNLFHNHPADMDALLVGPAGQNVMLMSDVGELLSEADSTISQVTITFRDGAPLLPSGIRITTGTYTPTNYPVVLEEIGEMDQTGPAMPPAEPYGTSLSAFNGTNPAGVWKLFIQDDVEDESGELGSWSITITTIPEPGAASLLAVGGGIACAIRRRRQTILDQRCGPKKCHPASPGPSGRALQSSHLTRAKKV